MYTPEQELFKAELLIRQGTVGYEASFRTGGLGDVTTSLGNPPALPRPGTVPPREYGHQLFDWIFRDDLRSGFLFLRELASAELPQPRFRGMWRKSRDDMPSIRLLLRIEPGSPLSEFAWETLCFSPEEPPLSVSIAFSRFVYAPTPNRPMIWDRPLRILFIVSNPDGLRQFDLHSVDQKLEREVLSDAERRLEGRLQVKRLLRPSLEDLRREARTGYHIAHLLAHATLEEGLGGVLLADNSGNAVNVGLREVADAIASPSDVKAPHLVFLALPVNGAAPQGSVLMELSSLLIRGGVQSAVVVKAPMKPHPLATFMERFYEVLLDTGAIDVAVAEARKRVFWADPRKWDWTWPVLFTRAAGSSVQQRLPAGIEATVDRITI